MFLSTTHPFRVERGVRGEEENRRWVERAGVRPGEPLCVSCRHHRCAWVTSPAHPPPCPGDQPGGDQGKPGPERTPLGGEFTYNAGRSPLRRKRETPSRWMSCNFTF